MLMESPLSGHSYCRFHQERAADGAHRAGEHDEPDHFGLLRQRKDLSRGVACLLQCGPAYAQQDGAPENWLELASPTRPLGRLVQPWEAANLIAFCLSPESGLLTGNVIDIDQTVQGAGEPPLPGSEETPQP